MKPSATGRSFPRDRPTLVMVGLITAMFFAMTSNTIVLTALPRITTELHTGQAEYTWIVTASLLTMTVFTPVWSTFSDRVDRKLLILLAIGGYGLASVGAGMAGDARQIIAFRVLVGVSVAGIVALLQRIAAEIATPRQRARWFGYLGAAMSVATVAGPALGGVVVDAGGWRWAFFCTLPLAGVALVLLTLFYVPRPVVAGPRGRLDLAGAGLIAAAVVGLVHWGQTVGPQEGFGSVPSVLLLAGVAVCGLGVIVAEHRAARPLLPPELLRSAVVRRLVLAGAVTGVVAMSVSVFLTQFFQLAQGRSATESGLLTLPMAVGSSLAALTSGHLIGRSGAWKPWLVGASALLVAGSSVLATIDARTPVAVILGATLLLGLGLGVLGENLVLVAQVSVAPTDLGAVSGLVLFSRSLGSVLAVSLLGSVFSAGLRSSGGYGEATALVFLVALPVVFLGAVGLARLPHRLLPVDHHETPVPSVPGRRS